MKKLFFTFLAVFAVTLIGVIAIINQTDNEKETQGVYLVDISSADIKELMNIPFIGYSKALNIIEYREQHGFSCIDDLKNVTGIGDKTFEKIRNYVTISTKKFEYRQTKVKINSDSIQKLEELEGIGEKTANIILEYRKIKTIENMDELKKITGMSDKQIEKIRGYIEF
ncbi:MAG TPA: helix-hairpin-helix domain-containing protein [Petrotogaceae bacterium]|nr:helix-hairpin-helix domain-containing protein [Petrotogaceae bacterium]HNV04648.1 helix-hairpin-helix domain-containing protein [Petrotogaceae bacterium]HNY36615.1 helix-hairpin-helix domain-containing protein [Petrotogaceae bacterium]HOG34628.1 helix-hairpin-helix domain-containing protein [Petrotogaceae bacterium]HPX15163.1 helix-hairpin-helix domain-containing protein [Petrotogaceae bacterium]